MDAFTLSIQTAPAPPPASAGGSGRGRQAETDPPEFQAALDRASTPRHDDRASTAPAGQQPDKSDGHAGASGREDRSDTTVQAEPRARTAAAGEGRPAASPHQRTDFPGDGEEEEPAADADVERDLDPAVTAPAPIITEPQTPPQPEVVCTVDPAACPPVDVIVPDQAPTQPDDSKAIPEESPAAVRGLPRGIAAQDAVRSPGPPAYGIRARVAAAASVLGGQGDRPASEQEPVGAQPVQPLTESCEEARPPVDGQVVSAASPGSRRAAAPSAAPVQSGRAYLAAMRSFEGELPDLALAAAAARLSATGAPVDSSGGPRETPRATAVPGAMAALSAHAAAFLRSLSAVNAAADEPQATTADLPVPPADLMARVAVEFAAAGAGFGRRNSEQEGTWRDPGPARPTPQAGDALSRAPQPFTVTMPSASTATPELAAGVPVAAATEASQGWPIAGQIVKAATLAWRDGLGEARIRLNPEHLGEVVISMKVERGQVVAQVAAENATTRGWIESHQQELRDGLLQHGLQLDRLVVTADGQRQRQSQDDGGGRPRRPQTRHRQGETPPRFELTA